VNITVTTPETEPAIRIVTLSGEMDLYSSSAFKEEVTGIWEAGGTRVIVDLTELQYVDSSGIGVLLYVYSASRKRRFDVVFVGARGSVWKVIELTRLSGFLPFESDIESALQQLTPPAPASRGPRDEGIRQILVDERSPLFDTRGMYHKAFILDLSQVRRLANLIAQRAPTHLRDINILEQQISELLKNAVRHGNRNDPGKSVQVWFLFTDSSARLIVEDEGSGFQTIEEWNDFYRQKIEAYRRKEFDRLMEFLSYRTENSTEHDGGNAMMAAVEYWNDGVVFNDRRNRVAAMRSFGEEGVPE
jgi:serine/threonine-protein kinase RsbW